MKHDQQASIEMNVYHPVIFVPWAGYDLDHAAGRHGGCDVLAVDFLNRHCGCNLT